MSSINEIVQALVALIPIAVSVAAFVFSVVQWNRMKSARAIENVKNREEARRIAAEADKAELGAAAQVVISAEESVEAAARITEISQQQLKLVLQQVTMLKEQLTIERESRKAREGELKLLIESRDKEIAELKRRVEERDKTISRLERRVAQLEKGNGNGNHH